MSLVGIRILSAKLREIYGGKSYIIRCYHKGLKFFEIILGKSFVITATEEAPEFIDVKEATFAYVMKN